MSRVISFALKNGVKHSHADLATYATFWRRWLAQLKGGFISRVGSGVVGVLCRSAKGKDNVSLCPALAALSSLQEG
jgi:hypothetical protein